ncbi:hypothetical protein [Kribbella sp. NPDC003557]|uniref:hypothetical protein n=1 Tax=Kribbella sp. NPDC003557 TaxID=3154449 RepID=UPI0033BD1087
MEDTREVSTELHRLADAEQLEPMDTAHLLDRGHRGRRRRRILTAGGAAVGVAAIAVAAAVLPNQFRTDDAPVAGDQHQEAAFESVAGVTRGDDTVGVPVSNAEALRRCRLRLPDLKAPLADTVGGYRIGDRAVSRALPKVGDKMQMCTVPGGDRPTAALLAKLRKDPVPTDPATQLLNCSAQTWVDVTKWRIVASARSKTWPSVLLTAVSPDGRKAIACEIEKNSLDGGMVMRGTTFLNLDSLRQVQDPILTPAKGSQRADLYTGRDLSGQACSGKRCWEVRAWGRVASSATRIHLQMGPSATTDIPVTDGWFAYIWLSPPTTATMNDLKVTAFDKDGKVVKVLEPRAAS